MQPRHQAPAQPGTVPFVRALGSHGDRPALLLGDGDDVSYAELANRVDAVAARLGAQRRLVMVTGSNDVDCVVTYLGALAGGHPVLLAPGGDPLAVADLVALYDPDVVAGPAGGGWELQERRPGSRHVLHPDLALLLSTSGSTGSPKLVRLSHANLQANAEAITGYLGIRAADRAATTLPLHYCYGLSVLHSHLLAGAGVVLTGLSVVDPCFWQLVGDKAVTTFAGVPHTFDLLDRVGFAEMDLPSLRYVTQAGGRLAPERVRELATLGRRRGWDLFVMYGQTEATARMAYLPPDLAIDSPASIGRPVPGGSFRLDPVPGWDAPDTGELVYRGPNVMLGYAQSPDDLALGRVVDELRTGDVARRCPDGLYEVVGRRSRFVKVVGLRVDLQRAEAVLAQAGVAATCTGRDGELVVAVPHARDVDPARRVATGRFGLPRAAVRVLVVPELPRLASGKPDYRALAALAGPTGSAEPARGGDPLDAVPAQRRPPTDVATLRRLYAELLDRADVTDDSTFVGLGGDSLSYVEMSVRLEQLLGHLPAGWHTTPLAQLVTTQPSRRRSRGALETTVGLRAVGIVLIVGTHIGLFTLLGSAHILLAVAGYNFARFHVTAVPRLERLRRQARSIVRVVVPSVAWIGFAYLVTDRYSAANVVLLNGLLGPDTWTRQWDFWFVEVLVYVLVVMAALLSVPWVDRFERRRPLLFVGVLVAVGLVGRYGLLDLGLLHTKPVLWLFALGWAAARVTTRTQRAVVTVVVLATVPGFFGDPARDALIAAGLTAVVWVREVPCPAAVARIASVLAAASLYIYLTHWLVYPALTRHDPLLALAASVAVGIAYCRFAGWAGPRLARTGGALLRR